METFMDRQYITNHPVTFPQSCITAMTGKNQDETVTQRIRVKGGVAAARRARDPDP